jgi:DUF971 family protein
MTPSDRTTVRPAEIVHDPDANLLRILWLDDHESIYELDALRPHCPCALCRGEMGRPGLVTPDTQFTAEQTTMLSLREVGRYALQPTWGDGHESGLYTFTLLRALCPCDRCGAAQGPTTG